MKSTSLYELVHNLGDRRELNIIFSIFTRYDKQYIQNSEENAKDLYDSNDHDHPP